MASTDEVLKTYGPELITTGTLERLGDDLAPTETQNEQARAVVDKVASAVHRCPRISVDRCCVSGSFGKKIALCEIDIQLIVVVNNELQPPFRETLKKLNQDLPTVLPGTKGKKTTNRSVQFMLDGFKVDLLSDSASWHQRKEDN